MAKESLAAKVGAVAEQFKLPAVFQAPQEAMKARYVPPYITFAHPKRSDEWARIVGQLGAATEGEMYLLRQDNVVHLSPCKCSLLCCRQFWGEVNAAGELLRVSFEEMPKPFKEHAEVVLLVYLNDAVLPANVRFRSVKCPVAKALSDALIAAADPSWGDKSPAHRETLICTQPWMRFVGDAVIAPPRTSRMSGMLYRPAQCSVRPTGVAEWRAIKNFCESPSAQKSLDDAAAWYNARIDELAKKAK